MLNQSSFSRQDVTVKNEFWSTELDLMQIWLESSWNDFSNVAEFLRFRVRMSELCHMEIWQLIKEKSNFRILKGILVFLPPY